MKTLFALPFVCALLATRLSAQDHCFEQCWDNLNAQKKNLPVTEQLIAQQELLEKLVGCPMPAFSLQTMEGQTITPENLKGKVVVLNFWFASCPPCLNELPGLNRLASEFAEQEVVFVALGRDQVESVQDFVSRHEFRYLHVADCYFNGVNDLFCLIGGFPSNLIFDRNGMLAYRSAGGSLAPEKSMAAYEKMQPVIQRLLFGDKR